MFLVFLPIKAENIYPNKDLKHLEILNIQLKALQNNDSKDLGIEQTWLFAHPQNKLATGPYPRFKSMLYDSHYQILLNHKSNSITLLRSDNNKFVYEIKIVAKDNKNIYYYEWQIEKGTEDNCTNCWFTSSVSFPQIKGRNL